MRRPDIEVFELVAVYPGQILDLGSAVDCWLESSGGSLDGAAAVDQGDDMVIGGHSRRAVLVQASDELAEKRGTQIFHLETHLFSDLPAERLLQRFTVIDMASGKEVPAAVGAGGALITGPEEEDLPVTFDGCTNGHGRASFVPG
jgi:hypothetical protein